MTSLCLISPSREHHTVASMNNDSLGPAKSQAILGGGGEAWLGVVSIIGIKINFKSNT